MYEALLLILLSLFALIAWRDLRHGIFLIAAALPSYLLRFEIFGVPMTFLETMILVLVLLWLLKHKSIPKKIPREWTPAIVLLLLAACLAVFIAPDTTSALGVLKAYFIEPVLLFLVIIHTLKKQDVFHVFTALGVSALFVASAGILQAATGLAIPAPWDIEGRITSIFPYPNAVGLYLGPLITLAVISFYAAIKMRSKKSQWFWGAVVLLSGIAILLAQTEAAFVAVPATLFLFSLFDRGLRKWTVPLFILAAIVILATPSFRGPVLEKITLRDYSGGVRVSQWKDTVAFLKDESLLGAGLSGYPQAIAPYHSRPEIEIFQYPHNILLNTWVELGVAGLLAFLFLGIVVLQASTRLFRSNAPAPIIAAAVLAPLVEAHIHGLVDVPYFKNDLAALTWLLLALLVVTSSHYASRPPIHPSKADTGK